MKFKEYLAHIHECLNKKAVCPLGCQKQFNSIEESQSHFDECPNKTTICPDCNVEYLNKDRNSHL